MIKELIAQGDKEIISRLDEIRENQLKRGERCATNEGRLAALESRLAEVEKINQFQWDTINQIKIHVYTGVGLVMAVSILIKYLFK